MHVSQIVIAIARRRAIYSLVSFLFCSQAPLKDRKGDLLNEYEDDSLLKVNDTGVQLPRKPPKKRDSMTLKASKSKSVQKEAVGGESPPGKNATTIQHGSELEEFTLSPLRELKATPVPGTKKNESLIPEKVRKEEIRSSKNSKDHTEKKLLAPIITQLTSSPVKKVDKNIKISKPGESLSRIKDLQRKFAF